jgi:hypothetical protein
MSNKPDHVERGGEVRPDTRDKWSDDDTARQEYGLPKSPKPGENEEPEHGPGKGTHAPAKGNPTAP